MLDRVRTFHLAVLFLAAAALPLLQGCEEEQKIADVVGEELENPDGGDWEVDEAGRRYWRKDGGADGDAGAVVADAGQVTADAGTRVDAGTDAGTVTAPDAGTTGGGAAGQLDADGVIMLATPKPDGASWRLGDQDPNAVSTSYFQLWGAPATKVTEGPLTFWTTTGRLVTYANNQPDGRTARFYMRPSDGSQKYKWNTGAATYGYLANSKDPKNFEATAYVRVRGNLGSHISMTWILRGGAHSSTDGDLASASGMQIAYSGQTNKAFRELTHPNYDYVYPGARFGYAFTEGKWLATKVVSWVVPGGTMNRLYVDTAPWTSEGKPRNSFQLLLEWNDKDGTSTGRYTRAPMWGGYQTSFRVDGWNNLDFKILSVREIVPPG